MKYKLLIRTPDDYDAKGIAQRWTAQAEGPVGKDYHYHTINVAVELEFYNDNGKKVSAADRWIGDLTPLAMPRPAPKPSQTKKSRGRKSSTVDGE